MFKFLKKKLGKAISSFSKDIEKESEEVIEEIESKTEVKKKPKKIAKKEKQEQNKQKKTKQKDKITKKQNQDKTEEPKEETAEEKPNIKLSISEKKFNDLFWDIELALMENNVAIEVIEKLKQDLQQELLGKKLNPFKLTKIITETFKQSLQDIFDIKKLDLIKEIKNKQPYVILFVGVNGSGKTTSLAKLAYLLKKNKLQPVLAACDTFRAAALHQIQEHADNLKLRLIKHDYGSDAAAVAYDAIQHTKSKKLPVVLIDTAGRSHSNVNLMDELKKVARIANPDLTIFVGDSLTGNDTVEQAKKFNEIVGIDAIILSKMDVDEKGGAAISVSYITKKPIIYTGTGQDYSDLEEFDKNKITDSLNF